jgi:hypothetical protein
MDRTGFVSAAHDLRADPGFRPCAKSVRTDINQSSGGAS